MDVFQSSSGMKFLDIITYPEIKIPADSFSFISGRSGCGKSTLLKILNRTVIPSFGNIFYNNTDIQTLPILEYRKDIMLVPQEVFLLDNTIEDNFNFYYDARECTRPDEATVKRFLNICCVDFDMATDCKTLSGGERQRVFISIFLSCMPKVIMFDEPTAALDINTSEQLLTNIKQFTKENNMTSIIICHNNALIESFSDYTVKLGE